MKTIDLNVDLGEGLPWDRELMQIATSVNICIGGYAGSEILCLATAEHARAASLAVGAHFGYEDPVHFGRESDPDIAAIAAMIDRCQRVIPALAPDYLKPHGAFYNDTASGRNLEWLSQIRTKFPLPMLGLAGSAHATTGPTWSEGFADRGYAADGTLLSRAVAGGVLTDLGEIRAQAVHLAAKVDSICLHGDHPGCVPRAAAVREALEAAGFVVRRCAPSNS